MVSPAAAAAWWSPGGRRPSRAGAPERAARAAAAKDKVDEATPAGLPAAPLSEAKGALGGAADGAKQAASDARDAAQDAAPAIPSNPIANLLSGALSGARAAAAGAPAQPPACAVLSTAIDICSVAGTPGSRLIAFWPGAGAKADAPEGLKDAASSAKEGAADAADAAKQAAPSNPFSGFFGGAPAKAAARQRAPLAGGHVRRPLPVVLLSLRTLIGVE